MITLSWPPRELSPNARCHWAVAAVKRRKAKTEAFYATKAANVAPGRVLRLTFNPPRAYRYDLDGLLSRMKGPLDGIAAAWGVDDYTFNFQLVRGEPVAGGRVLVEVLA